MANPWFRMYAEFAHDPKVQIMPEVMQRRYIMLMCLRCNGDVTLHETEIAFALRISDDELAATKALFLSKGFIDESWNLLNWEKRQFASDTSAARVAKHRNKLKQARNADVTLHETKSNVLDTDTDTDITDTDVSVVASDADDQHAGESKHETPAIPACPHEKIIALYTELLPTGIVPKVWTGTRATHLKARWREDAKRQNIAYWRKLFTYIGKSPFLTGKTTGASGRPFEISLDWIVMPENFAKIIEGKYHEREAE